MSSKFVGKGDAGKWTPRHVAGNTTGSAKGGSKATPKMKGSASKKGC